MLDPIPLPAPIRVALATGLSVAAIVAILSLVFGVPPAITIAVLVASQAATILSMGAFSREHNACFAAMPLALSAASFALPVLPAFGMLPHNLCTVLSLILGAVNFLVLVRHPRMPLGLLVGKVVVVTGCNSGVGLETAAQLLALGATVIFACRSESRARPAMRANALQRERAQAAQVVGAFRLGAEEGAELEAGGEAEQQQRVGGPHGGLLLSGL